MRRIRKFTLVVLTAFLLFSCAGCAKLLSTMEDETLRDNTEMMLDTIMANDLDAAYALIDDVCTKEEFRTVFTTARELFHNADTYDLKLLNIYHNRSFDNGEMVDSVEATYLMTIGTERYILNTAMHSIYEDLSAFHINLYENTDYYKTGEIGAMADANVFQWIMLCSNLILIAFTIYALTDACRHKMKLKVLWIVIIVLGFASIGVTLSATRLNFNLNINWIFAYSALILHGSGTIIFRIMLPIGAILYLALRKRLIINSASEISEPQTAVPTETPLAEMQVFPIDESVQESTGQDTDIE